MKSYRKFNACCLPKPIEKFKVITARKFHAFCNYGLMGSPIYVFILGLIGALTMIYDIIRTVRRYSKNNSVNYIDTSLIQRDIKCMTAILGIEHYILLLLGVITEFPMLYIQWLLLQACIFITEISVFFIKILSNKSCIKFSEICHISIAIFNWLQVFCLFLQHLKLSCN